MGLRLCLIYDNLLPVSLLWGKLRWLLISLQVVYVFGWVLFGIVAYSVWSVMCICLVYLVWWWP